MAVTYAALNYYTKTYSTNVKIEKLGEIMFGKYTVE